MKGLFVHTHKQAARHFFQDLAESNEAQQSTVLYQVCASMALCCGFFTCTYEWNDAYP